MGTRPISIKCLKISGRLNSDQKIFLLHKSTVCLFSSFESTDWLLSSFERTLLDEIDNNIHIEPLNDIKFKATVRINNEIVSATNSKPGDAKSSLILRAFKQTEKQKNTFIVVAKPIVVKLEKKDSDDEDVKPILKPGMSSRDIIKFFRKKALGERESLSVYFSYKIDTF